MRQKISPKIVSLTFGILVICFAVGFYIYAWTEPTTLPPGGNVDAPINVGADLQVKSGALLIRGVFETENETHLAWSSGNVGIGTTEPSEKLDVVGYVKGQTGLCIGDDCRESWPSSAGDNLGDHTATQNLNLTNHKIINLLSPTANLDGANKQYVDAQVSAAGGNFCYSLKCAWHGIDTSIGTGEGFSGSGRGYCAPASCASGWTDSGQGCAITAVAGNYTANGYCERWCCK